MKLGFQGGNRQGNPSSHCENAEILLKYEYLVSFSLLVCRVQQTREH